jgi:hypothetical protein
MDIPKRSEFPWRRSSWERTQPFGDLSIQAVTFTAAVVVVLSTIASACGDDDKTSSDGGEPSPTVSVDLSPQEIAGTYNCGIPDFQPEEIWQITQDGKVTATAEQVGPEAAEGTWSIVEGRVVVNFAGREDPFEFDGSRLIYASPDPEGPWICTPVEP